jgi:hypothetical protein
VLAVTERLPVPTVAEPFPGFYSTGWYAVVAVEVLR